MNRGIFGGGLLAISIAAITVGAAPNPPPTPTWADWVGRYEGTLAWSACSVPGAKTAALSFELGDGVATMDLSSARPGLREMSLVSDERGWSAQQGDVKLTLVRPRANTLAVTIELESGCTMRARLSRSSTTVAACDTLVGWSRIASRCTKLPSDAAATEPLAKLLATKWKPTDAAGCTTRANKLSRALVDAGCAPHPDPQIGSRARDCLDFAQVAARVARCASVPQDLKDQITSMASHLVAAAQTASKATLPYVEEQCRDTRALALSIATRSYCP